MNHNILTLKDVLAYSVEHYANNIAFEMLDETQVTYKEVGDTVVAIQALLENLGIKQHDRVALYSQNMPNWSITYFAITSMGAVVVPILPDFTAAEIDKIMKHSGSSAIFVSDGLVSKIKGICKDIPLIKIDDFSSISGVSNSVQYDSQSISTTNYSVDTEDLAAIIYTSGTTGNPKGVMLLHRNLCINIYQLKDLHPVGEHDRFISIMPLSHVLENTVGMLVPFLSGARVTYLRKPPTASVLLPALEKVKPTIMITVPLIIEKIFYNKIRPTLTSSKLLKKLYSISAFRKVLHRVAGKKLYKTFGGRLHFFGIGGAKLNEEVEIFLREGKFPYAIVYGLTETSPILAGMVPNNYKHQSTGVSAIDLELKIANPKPSGEGEIWAKGPNIMKGYYKEPELTSEVLTDDGWFKTGDLGIFDKDNFLFIKGRLKNVIVGASGENIYPEDIESVINNFKHVVESLVVEQKGKLVAMVHVNREELEEKYKHLKEEMARKVEEAIEELLTNLHNQVNSRINKFSRLHRVVFQPVPFQKTATLKIKRYLYL